jgi:hypothetical protein
MKVAVVQVDGKMPNLALMKIAGWYRQQGHQVVMGLDGSADRAYISVIFPQNKPQALSASTMFTCSVEIGGSGYDYEVTLPEDIEHTMPDYEMWNIDYSMGFTSRGCIRRCTFCIVPKKEGGIRQHSPLSEFVHEDHKKVILLDNNILAAPNFIDTAAEIHDRGLKVNFNQGLDIRLIDEEKAAVLGSLKYYNWTFKTRLLYFAFDNMRDEAAVRKGVEILEHTGVRPANLIFYMLVGFDTTFEEDLRRYQILWEELGVYPFVMIYNRQATPTLRAFARWVNKRVHKVCSWADYEHGPKKKGMLEVPS